MSPTRFPRRSLLAVLLGGSAASLSAQSPADPAPAADHHNDLVTLSPFLVQSETDTGFRAAQTVSGARIVLPSLLVPQSITTLNADALRASATGQIDDVIKLAGVQRYNYVGNSYNIRGFSALSELDGLPLSGNVGWDTAIADRIDVVKGPSGVLFGSGSPGGAVNVISKRPLARPLAFARIAAADSGSNRVEFDYNQPVATAGFAAVRVSGAYDHQVSDQLFGRRDMLTVFPQFTVAGRAMRFDTQVIVQQTPDWVPWNERFPQLNETVTLPSGETIATAIRYVPGVPEDFNVDGPASRRHDQNLIVNASLTLAPIERLNLKLDYRHATFDQSRDLRFLGARPSLTATGALSPYPVPVQVWHDEMENTWDTLAGTGDWQLVAHRSADLRLVADARYQWARSAQAIYWNPSPGIALDILNPPRDASDPRFASQYRSGHFPSDFNLTAAFPAGSVFRDQIAREEFGSVSGLLFGRFWDDRLTFTAGARVDRRLTSHRVDFSRTLPSIAFNSISPAASLVSRTAGFTGDLLSTKEHTGALTHAVGFAYYGESKLFNPPPFERDPRQGKGAEAGLRLEWFGGKAFTTVSWFSIEQSNIPRRDSNFGGAFTLSGRERSRGGELEVHLVPNDLFSLMLGWVQQDPEVVTHPEAAYLVGPGTGDGAYRTAVQGLARLNLDRTIPGFSVSASVVHRGERIAMAGDAGLFLFREEPYTTASLSVDWQLRRKHPELTISAFCRNLTDEFYTEAAMTPGERRSFWIAASAGF